VSLLVLAGLVFAGLQMPRQREVVIQQLRQRLRDAASIGTDLFADALTLPQNEKLQRQVVRLGKQTGARFTLITEDGTVLADSWHAPANMENHRNRPELVEARRRGIGEAQRVSPTLGIPMMYFALRVGEADHPKGFVRVALSMADVDEQVAAVRRIIWTTSLIGTAAALALTWLVVGRIVRPVRVLTEAASAIQRGQFPEKITVANRDELGTLADAFNAMSEKLQSQIKSLRAQHEELEKTAGLLETVLEAMQEGVIVVDADGSVLYANEAARRLLHVPTVRSEGRPLWELTRDEAIHEMLQKANESTSPVRAELQIGRTGACVQVFASRLPGKPSPGAVLVLSDLTELRRLERMRRDFVSNVSHELKTPLTAIQSCAETLLDGAIHDEQYNRVFLRQIQQQSERLHALIIDLLSLSKLESGGPSVQLESVCLDTAVGECIADHLPVADARGVVLRAQPPERKVLVRANAEGIRSILDNLVDNAIKYTPDGGTVTVRWHQEQTRVRLDVVDTGIGIPKEHQDRIFERFYRVDKARSRELGGTGLGLSLVKHWSQLFGGRAEVQSQPGQGSTFTVWLRGASADATEEADATLTGSDESRPS